MKRVARKDTHQPHIRIISQSGTRKPSEKNVVVIDENVTDATRRYPPLKPFIHLEHGKDADTSFPELLRNATSVIDITPNIGAEIRGVQISSLTDAGKDQLALFTAQKKVVGESDHCIEKMNITN